MTVDALTSQTSITTAEPDGTFTTAFTASPTRILRNGAWIPVDTTLKAQPDGTFAPAAVPGALALSGGGSSALVAQAQGSTVYRMSWPGKLPKPKVAGDTATYTDVLPGVDFKLTATPTGVRQLIVVKTQAAAANPAVKSLGFPVTVAGGSVSTAADGSLTVSDAKGKPMFHGGAPTMWDSSGDPTEAAAAPDQAPHTARWAPMKLAAPAQAATSTTVTLTPDPTLLADPAAVFPLVLDPDTTFPTLTHYDTVWDVAPNSNYIDDGSSLRSGHVWDQNNARYQTNRSFMNFAGLASVINGKTVRNAWVALYNSYSASCTGTSVELWSTNSISSSTTWNSQPTWASKLDGQTFAHGYNSGCPQAQVSLNAKPQLVNAAAGGWDNVTMGLRSTNESDAASWKIFESIKPGFTPKLIVSWSAPVSTPGNLTVNFGSVTQGGANLCGGWAGKITPGTPLLVGATYGSDGDGATVTTTLRDSAGNTDSVTDGPVYSGWHQSNKQFTDSWLQNDGNTVTVTVTASNSIGQTSTNCSFQVDSVSPAAPTVASWDYPQNDWGPDLLAGGAFHITPNSPVGNQTWYHVVPDGQDVPGKTWDQSPAQWGQATGFSLNCPGCASKPFTTPGLHWITVQAVSKTGNKSPLAGPYYFFISPNPIQVDNATGLAPTSANSGTVTPGTQPITDAATGTAYTHEMLWGAPNGASLSFTDTLGSTMPAGTGYFAVEGVMTSSYDYGKVALSVKPVKDANGVTPTDQTVQQLTRTFDGYRSGCCVGAAFDFGGATLTKGWTYQFTFTAVGANPAAVSPYYNIAVTQLRLVPLHYTYNASNDPNTNLASAFDNIGITDPGTVGAGNFDGSGNSYDQDSLKRAGYGPGTPVTIDGVRFAMPNVAPGTPSAMVVSGQTIGLGNTTGSAVGLLGSLSYASVGGSGRINYQNNCNGSTSQGFTIAPVPDWGDSSTAAADRAAVTGLNWNSSTGWAQRSNSLYSIMIPVQCQNDPLVSIDLPYISPNAFPGYSSLKLFSIGVRPPTQGSKWDATWATSLDATTAVPAGTLRMPVHASMGGTSVRVRLDNPYASAPIVVNAASVGLQGTGAAIAGTAVPLTFGGSSQVTIPAGGQVYSDSAALSVPQGANLLVSLDLPAATLAAHAKTPATTWTAPAGNSTTASAAGFATAGTGWVLVDDVEVTPAAGAFQVGTMAVLGDDIANGDATTADQNQRVGDYIAGDLPNVAAVANVSTSGNRLLSDRALGSGGPSALTRFDRDVCELPNLSTVVIDAGLRDLTDGASNIAIDGNPAITAPWTGLTGAAAYARACGAKAIAVPPSPFSAASAWNTAVGANWTALRSDISSNNANYDGKADCSGTACSVSVLSDSQTSPGNAKLATADDSGDHLTPNDTGMHALADALVSSWKQLPSGAVNWFRLDRAHLDPSTGDVLDSAQIPGTDDGLPSASVQFITPDRGPLGAARFNGTDAYVNIPDQDNNPGTGPLNTTGSFTVSAWVNLATTNSTTGFESAVAQNGSQQFGYELGYDRATGAFRFAMNSADSASSTLTAVESANQGGAQWGAWNHLVGEYDSVNHQITLYVNGVQAASPATFNPNPAVNFNTDMSIGNARVGSAYADWFAGDISDVVDYGRLLNPTEIQVLYTSLLPYSGLVASVSVAATATANTGVVVDATASHAGAAPIANYTFDFGDGTAPVTQNTAVATHTYTASGTYTVHLTVTDTAGVSSTAIASTATAAAAGWWKLNERTGTTAADSGSPGGHPAAATGNVRLTSGGFAQFDGAAGENLATSGPVLDTSKSFSVSAWVKLNDTSQYYPVAAQNGNTSFGFWLGYDHNLNAWALTTIQADANQTSWYTAAGAAGSATPGRWTHLVGEYNAATGKLALYVNGVLQSRQDSWPTPFNAPGPIMIGNSKGNGSIGSAFAGGIAEVRLFQTALSTAQVAGLYQGSWFTQAGTLSAPTTLTSNGGTPAGCSSDPSAPSVSASTAPALGATVSGTGVHAEFEIREVTNPNVTPPLLFGGTGSASAVGTTVSITAPALVSGHKYAFAARTVDGNGSVSAPAASCYIQIGTTAAAATGASGLLFDGTVYRTSAGAVTWQGPTDVLKWQTDGNLVVYKPSGQPIWSSGTAGHPNAALVAQTDGNLAIYDTAPTVNAYGQVIGTLIWSTGTSGRGGNNLVVQTDGNVVVYGPSGALWGMNGNVQSFQSVATGNCLDSSNGSVYTGACNGGGFQQWVITDNGDNTWSLKDSASGQCLDGNGSSVYAMTCNGGGYQRWYHTWGGSGWILKSQAVGMVLDAGTGSAPYFNSQNGGGYQQWK